jgi:hypothetical protein
MIKGPAYVDIFKENYAYSKGAVEDEKNKDKISDVLVMIPEAL